MPKFWNFTNGNEADDPVELRIEGDIISDDDAWLYELFGIPLPPSTSPNAFRSELAQYAGRDIVVWIDSYGGDVFAAAGIYSALMEHKQKGPKITTKIPNKAMSAATIPYMAGDERYMSPVAIYMMHNPLTEARGYASDLRKTADVLDVVKETILNAYQLGSGRSRDEISSMMDDETYMSAKTAVKEGFATGILYSTSSEGQVDPVFNFSRNLILNSASETMRRVTEFGRKLEGAEPLGAKLLNQEPKTPNQEPKAISQEPKVLNAGRTLSAENEQRITDARDLLNEVLGQLDTTEGGQASNSAGTPGPPGSPGPPSPPNPSEPTAPTGGTDPPDNLRILKAKLALELIL